MAASNSSKVIFFTAGAQPTEQERALIAELQSTTFYLAVRSNAASQTYDVSRREECSYVAGNVPTNYADKPVWQVGGASDIPMFTEISIHDEETKVTAVAPLEPYLNEEGTEIIGVQVPRTNVLLKDGQTKTVKLSTPRASIGSGAVTFGINSETGHMVSIKSAASSPVSFVAAGTLCRISAGPIGAPLYVDTVDSDGLVRLKPEANNSVWAVTGRTTTAIKFGENPQTQAARLSLTIANTYITAAKFEDISIFAVSTTKNFAYSPEGVKHRFDIDANGDIVLSVDPVE